MLSSRWSGILEMILRSGSLSAWRLWLGDLRRGVQWSETVWAGRYLRLNHPHRPLWERTETHQTFGRGKSVCVCVCVCVWVHVYTCGPSFWITVWGHFGQSSQLQRVVWQLRFGSELAFGFVVIVEVRLLEMYNASCQWESTQVQIFVCVQLNLFHGWWWGWSPVCGRARLSLGQPLGGALPPLLL